MKRKATQKNILFSSTRNRIAKNCAYYNYASFIDEAISERVIEGALLATTTPKISVHGLEQTSLSEGWWYTGVDEERIDQLIDSVLHAH